MVPMTETKIEPTQPRRLEKNPNTPSHRGGVPIGAYIFWKRSVQLSESSSNPLVN